MDYRQTKAYHCNSRLENPQLSECHPLTSLQAQLSLSSSQPGHSRPATSHLYVLPAAVMASSSFHRPQPRLPARWKHGAPLPCVHCPTGSPVSHHPTNTGTSPPVLAEPGQLHSPAPWIEAHGASTGTRCQQHCSFTPLPPVLVNSEYLHFSYTHTRSAS